MNKSKLFFALGLLFFPVFATPLSAAGCENCARRAALVEFQNLHAPDYENQLDEWRVHGPEIRARDPLVTVTAVINGPSLLLDRVTTELGLDRILKAAFPKE